MKRNLLFLALFVAAFCFTGSAIAQNDPGVPDTLYLEAWASDVGVMEPGPWFFKVPMYVTNDIVDPVLDSIAGFVVPLCYHADVNFGAVTYCSVSGFWNATTLNPYDPAIDRSVFRDLPNNASPVIFNRMFALDRDFSQRGWDFRFIDFGTGTDHFWMSLVPTGSQDQRWWEGSRTLLATMTFKALFADSFDLCIDSCFWPPSSRLAFSNSAAATYIPKIWDDYLGEEEYCFRPFIIPNIPPYFDPCPDPAATHYTNATGVQLAFTAKDDDGQVTGVTATPTGTGFGNVTVTYTVPPPAAAVSGYVSYDVTNHCLDGGYIELIATDDAGATNEDWNDPAKLCEPDVVLGNHAPTVTCPANATFKYCDGYAGVAVGTDTDGDAISYGISGVAGIAIDGSGNITWDTDCNDVGGPYTITVTVTDVCQATGQCTFDLTVTNAPPTIACPPNGVIVSGAKFVSGNFTPWDDCPPAVVTASISAGATNDPVIVDNHVEWQTVDEEGFFTITLTITDECNDQATCDFQVEVLKQPMVNIGPAPDDPAPCANPGDLVMVPITIVSGFPTPLGGFELHIDFDYTSMTFVQAKKGDLIDGTQYGDFEEFTYRLLPCPGCGCCKYKILLFGMYDLPNPTMGEPIPAATVGELVELYFVINSDENLRGFCIPICWQWTPCEYEYMIDPDCGENTFSDETGHILYTSDLACQFDLDCCDDPGGIVDQSVLFQVDATGFADCSDICYCIPICDEGEVDCKRGDINLNTITYEVADAVMFAAYHVEGPDAFYPEPEFSVQVCASDVNADGRPLTLSDLVYLIRVILQDAVAIPKLAPSSDVATMVVSDGTISAECASPIGAILFEFDGAVGASLLASNMEMMTNDNKVLVWSRNGNSIENAEVLSFSGAELTSVTAVDRDSRELGTAITVRMTPTAFALHAAYPNPFNPFVNLSFSMPEAASYSLSIYNVAGQLVRSYEGMGTAGLNVVTWDGKDNAGNEVSSGVYFYKLMAAGNSATAKMVMMK